MRTVLGRKARYRNDDVTAVWRDIESYVTRAEAVDAVEAAVAEARQVIAELGVRRPRYGWSGGKDSQALRVVMELADIPAGPCGLNRHLEFPAHVAWVDQHRPDGVVIYSNDELTIPWLARHPEWLFPTDDRGFVFWRTQNVRRPQHRYQAAYQPDLMVFGRRRADNNWIRKPNYGIHTDGKGMRQYSPLRDWSHELTLAVIHYYGMPLPPIYEAAPDGWVTGSGAWPGRHPMADGWASTYAVDPSVVEASARAGVPGAADHLAKVAA